MCVCVRCTFCSKNSSEINGTHYACCLIKIVATQWIHTCACVYLFKCITNIHFSFAIGFSLWNERNLVIFYRLDHFFLFSLFQCILLDWLAVAQQFSIHIYKTSNIWSMMNFRFCVTTAMIQLLHTCIYARRYKHTWIKEVKIENSK